MTGARKPVARPKRQAGTKQGFGSAILEGVDGRSWAARRYRELVADFHEHLEGAPTAPQEAIIRRAAQLAMWCEAREAEAAKGQALDVTAYVTAVNALRRLLVDLGLERRLKDVTPDLASYITARERSEGA